MEKTITILGSTGSIGTQALEVARKHKIKVKACAAYSNYELLARQVKEFGCEACCIYSQDEQQKLSQLLSGSNVKIFTGMQGLKEIAWLEGIDIMVNSVVGMVGLVPTMAAIEKGTDIALANKETLVAGGELVIKAAEEKGVRIFPVDSEHSAIFQALQGNEMNRIKSIILTASGGPFYGKTKEQLKDVTVEDALDHPNWSMGKKVTIDSATLMNKGLEFIEAMRLFKVKPEQINILVHRESVVHSAVEFEDNSVIAQMGVPDMKIPIQYALMYPERVESPAKRLHLEDYGKLTFAKPDDETFGCLKACIKAAKLGENFPAAVNGANEEAVKAFLEGKINFLDIGAFVMQTLENTAYKQINNVQDVMAADRAARDYVLNKLG